VPSVLNAGDFQRQYDWDVEFVHSGVDRGWHYWIISVSLTHATAFCNVNTQFQLLLSQCKTYGIVMWIWDKSKDRTSVLWWMNVKLNWVYDLIAFLPSRHSTSPLLSQVAFRLPCESANQ
jgi:hypothetical protein